MTGRRFPFDQKNGEVVVRYDPARQNEADLPASSARLGFPVVRSEALAPAGLLPQYR